MFFERENSNEDGSPVLLYEFRRGKLSQYRPGTESANLYDREASFDYRYTSSDRDVTILQPQRNAEGKIEKKAYEYKSTAISDEGISQTGESETDSFVIKMPSETEIVQLFRGTAPSDTVHLWVRRIHDGDNDPVIVWVGTVQGVTVNQVGLATVTCQQLTVSFNRDGLHLSWERGCPHALYDHNCRADKAKFGVEGVISAVLGNLIEVDAAASQENSYFSGGFFEYALTDTEGNLTGVFERRPIQSHTGNRVELLGLADGLDVERPITLYPGCTRNAKTCKERFNNYLNFGGFPFMPGKTPYDGDSVF